MGYSEKFRKKLEAQINQGKSKEDKVKLSFKAGKMVLTKAVSKQIRKDYDVINDAIEKLDTNDKLFPKKKHELLQLKKSVPKKYQISKGIVAEVQDMINEILGKPNKSKI
jgi:argininosuccinate lyase